MSLSQRCWLTNSITPCFVLWNSWVEWLHLEVSSINWAFPIIKRVLYCIIFIRRTARASSSKYTLRLDLIHLCFYLRKVSFLLSRRNQARHCVWSVKLWWSVSKLHFCLNKWLRKLLFYISQWLPSLILLWVLRDELLATYPLCFIMLSPFRSWKKQSIDRLCWQRNSSRNLILYSFSLIFMFVFCDRGGHVFHGPSFSENWMYIGLFHIVIGC